MVSLPRRLDKLEDDLNALPPEYDAMLLGELDGFIAAMIVCPVEIAAEEWLGHLWRDVAEDGVTKLDMGVVEALVPGILDHYRRVSLELKAGEDGYMAVYYTDPDDGSVAWQPWAAGFGEGMQLRMETWSAAATNEEEDEDVLAAIVGLMAAVSVAHGTRPEDLGGAEEGVDFPAMMAEAADLLPLWVETLFEWRYALRPDPVQAPVRVVQIGRNESCLCGSGRKYKKCCGAAGAL